MWKMHVNLPIPYLQLLSLSQRWRVMYNNISFLTASQPFTYSITQNLIFIKSIDNTFDFFLNEWLSSYFLDLIYSNILCWVATSKKKLRKADNAIIQKMNLPHVSELSPLVMHTSKYEKTTCLHNWKNESKIGVKNCTSIEK